MKLNKIIYTLFLGLAALLVSCEVDEKKPAPYDVGLDNVPAGAYLKTLSSTTPINLFDIANNTFEVTLEHNDNADGSLLQDVSVFLAFDDNSIVADNDQSVAESLYTTIPASAFSAGNKPTVTYTDATPDALAFLGLTEADLDGTDIVQYRFQVNLTDGSSFTNTNTNPNIISEQAFASPFLYNATVVCPVATDFLVGDYTLETVGSGIFGTTVFPQGTVTISVGGAEDERQFTAPVYPDLGSFGDITFTFQLVCGQVIIPSGQPTGVGCGASTLLGPTGVGTDYDAADDSTITLNVADNEGGITCGPEAPVMFILTKN